MGDIMVVDNSKMIEAILTHKLIAIVDLPLSSLHSNELSKNNIINELKKKLSITGYFTFEQIVDLGLRKQGKETFVSSLNRIISQNSNRAPGYYKMLEKMGIKYIVDAHYSPLFRNEVVDNGNEENYLFYSRDEDFSFNEDSQIIVSLFGDTEYNKDKLVISQNDFNGFFSNTNSISSSLRSIFKSTILFIDFDPNSSRFKSIYDYFCQQNGTYPSESFLISDTISHELSYGKAENLTIIKANAYDYIKNLASKREPDGKFYVLYHGEDN